MALVPEQGSGRLTAVLLFVIAVIFVYLLCFHWFILKHLDYSEEISGLSTTRPVRQGRKRVGE